MKYNDCNNWKTVRSVQDSVQQKMNSLIFPDENYTRKKTVETLILICRIETFEEFQFMSKVPVECISRRRILYMRGYSELLS